MDRKRLLRLAWAIFKAAIVLGAIGLGIRYRMTRPIPAIAHKIVRGDVVHEACQCVRRTGWVRARSG